MKYGHCITHYTCIAMQDKTWWHTMRVRIKKKKLIHLLDANLYFRDQFYFIKAVDGAVKCKLNHNHWLTRIQADDRQHRSKTVARSCCRPALVYLRVLPVVPVLHRYLNLTEQLHRDRAVRQQHECQWQHELVALTYPWNTKTYYNSARKS